MSCFSSRLISLFLLTSFLLASVETIAVLACGSLAPAKFTNTIGFVSELEKDGKRIHLLAYANTAENNAPGGNALFLPIPAVPGTMSEKNIVDTSQTPDFMDAMQRTVTAPLIDSLTATGLLLLACLVLWIIFPKPMSLCFRTVAKATIVAGFLMTLFIIVGIGLGLVGALFNQQAHGGPIAQTQTSYSPQDPSNVTVVHGVSPAGIVRLNNLARVEAIFSFLIIFIPIAGIIAGVVLILHGLINANFQASFAGITTRLGKGARILAGLELILVASFFPLCVSWILASAHMALTFGGDGPIVFDSGIYTVVLADDVSKIPGVLNKVPENKRPALNPEFFNAYDKWYKGWTFALCCFDNRDAKNSAPMVWWYEPKYPDLMFFPALDAHTGKPPDLNASVLVDHCLVVASDKAERFQDPFHMLCSPWREFAYNRDRRSDTNDFMPDRVMGRLYNGMMPQGDFVFRVNDVRHGIFEPLRVLPPGAGVSPSIWNKS